MTTWGQVIDKENKNCLLCQRKLNDTGKLLGSECNRKFKAKYNVAILNFSSGCSENCELFDCWRDVKDHFGTSVDAYIGMNFSYGEIEFYLDGDSWRFNMWDYPDFECYENDVDGNKALILAMLFDRGSVEFNIVHVDTYALTLVQHSHYEGPARDYSEMRHVAASCGCGICGDTISEAICSATEGVEALECGNSMVFKAALEKATEELSEVQSSWYDVSNIPDFETEWDKPLVSGIDDLKGYIMIP